MLRRTELRSRSYAMSQRGSPQNNKLVCFFSLVGFCGPQSVTFLIGCSCGLLGCLGWMVWRMNLLLLLALSGGAEAGKRKGKRDDAAPAPTPSPSPRPPGSLGDVWVVRTYSVTVTPFHENGGVPVPVAEREEGCRRMLNLLNAEIQLRHAYGQVLWLVCGLEHGEQNGNPHHLQSSRIRASRVLSSTSSVMLGGRPHFATHKPTRRWSSSLS